MARIAYETFPGMVPVADPGFPVGGRRPRSGGGVDSRGGYVSKILQAHPLDPPMGSYVKRFFETQILEKFSRILHL